MGGRGGRRHFGARPLPKPPFACPCRLGGCHGASPWLARASGARETLERADPDTNRPRSTCSPASAALSAQTPRDHWVAAVRSAVRGSLGPGSGTWSVRGGPRCVRSRPTRHRRSGVPGTTLSWVGLEYLVNCAVWSCSAGSFENRPRSLHVGSGTSSITASSSPWAPASPSTRRWLRRCGRSQRAHSRRPSRCRSTTVRGPSGSTSLSPSSRTPTPTGSRRSLRGGRILTRQRELRQAIAIRSWNPYVHVVASHSVHDRSPGLRRGFRYYVYPARATSPPSCSGPRLGPRPLSALRPSHVQRLLIRVRPLIEAGGLFSPAVYPWPAQLRVSPTRGARAAKTLNRPR